MAKTNIIASSRIVAKGGEITSDRYVSGGALVKGGLCQLSGGAISAVAAGAVDTSDGPASWFIALEDEASTGVDVNVQAVNADTVLEGYVLDTVGDVVTAPQTVINELRTGTVTADGKLGIDSVTTAGLFKIVDVMDNYDPYRNSDADGYEENSDGLRHDRVRFSIIASEVL